MTVVHHGKYDDGSLLIVLEMKEVRDQRDDGCNLIVQFDDSAKANVLCATMKLI